ncbi:MAG: hypothetical protein RL498_370 [Pseudomonadota bacterium]|jgi:hypothetical protein
MFLYCYDSEKKILIIIKRMKKTKESFCPVCVAGIPLAFSITGNRANIIDNEDNQEVETISERSHRKLKQTIFRIIFILSSLIIIYYTFFAPCDECRLKK